MSLSQIGFLVPLNRNLEEDTSTPKLPISTGANVIGRNSISVSDKRLSRKHLTLIASGNGFVDAVVVGTNPVVVASGNQRKKLRTGEKAVITNDDIIELIPGHYFFKYVTVAGKKCEKKGNSMDAQNMESNEVSLSRKRMRQVSEDEAFARKLQAEMENDALVQERSLVTGKSGYSQASTASIPSSHMNSEAIRHFSIPKDNLPLTYRLLRVKDLPAWANTSSVSIRDVIQGDVLIAVLSNYMVDIDWLLSSCPTLAKIPHVLVIHGEGDGTLDHMKKKKPPNWILHKPPLPISFGTHHSKAMLLVYPRGVRIIVHTANLIYVDWNNKSQGLWMQDFPWKVQKELSKGCAFENDLIDYLSVLKWPEFTTNLPALGSFNINSSFFKKFDYSNAVVRLIASVPGYHTGSNLKKWGHMKLCSVLQECIFDKEFQKSPLAYQFSSLGSLDEKWMTELASSMSSGSCDDKTPLGLGKPLIIWPTVEDVRCSLESCNASYKDVHPL
ncbi:hypothetical protein PVL29_012348 [Vitis rotundifolia]|uniref:Tyrosyl-DNA phosphodiesterase 1 n=1 Tax=Vitis rotundifolia TaxID=103349 RepID=A0AA39DM49_VITRO|nr:hypothetical protein PVL29_012348 [Vitis rotundifolia]